MPDNSAVLGVVVQIGVGSGTARKHEIACVAHVTKSKVVANLMADQHSEIRNIQPARPTPVDESAFVYHDAALASRM